MIAVEKGHLEMVNAMMEKNPDLVSLSVGSDLTVIHWALEKDNRNAFFKVWSQCLSVIKLYFVIPILYVRPETT